MKTQLRPTLVLFGLLTLLTGIVYPLFVTGVAQVFFPKKADGSLIVKHERIVGSALIGQDFVSDRYFWGRPSSTAGNPYNTFDANTLTASSGSNLGPLSQILQHDVNTRAELLRTSSPEFEGPIPIDLVTASASGLDPDISVDAALFQLTRVAQARGLDENVVLSYIEKNIITRQLGILGEPRVNVLHLNLDLDGIQ